MKIAILAPPWIAVPPTGYGGTEIVVHQLTEELVKKGHDVTLFATGDSKTSAKLQYLYKTALGNNKKLKENEYLILNHCLEFIRLVKSEKFDIVHNNASYIPMYFFDLLTIPFVHTLHGAFYKNLQAPSGYIEEKRWLLEQCKNHPYISISNTQRQDMPELNYVKTVYNSIDTQHFTPGNGKGNYLAWLGRVTYNKGLDIAIQVAKKAQMPLKIAAFVDEGDRPYFEEKIKPELNGDIEMIGEIRDPKEKCAFLGNAFATLFPIRWREPFGLVMVESMASGTPVIAFDQGSAPEVVEEGKTGFIVRTEEEMVEALKNIPSINRSYCHQYAISHFSISAMTDKYLEAYQIVINQYNNSLK